MENANIVDKCDDMTLEEKINKTKRYIKYKVKTTINGKNIDYHLSLLKVVDNTTKMVAYDNEGDYTSSDTVSFTVNPPTDKLPYYNFNLEKKITAVPDSSGNKLNGVCFGSATYEEGKFGNCIVLNGTNSYIRLPNNIINKLSNFTVSTWIYLTKKETWARIFDFGSSTTSSMFLTVDAGNSKMRFSLETELGSQYLGNSAGRP